MIRFKEYNNLKNTKKIVEKISDLQSKEIIESLYNFVSKNIQLLKEDNVIDSMKKTIIDIIKHISNLSVIQQVEGILAKPKIVDLVTDLLDSRDILFSDSKKFLVNIFVSMPLSVDRKIEFLTYLKNGSIINESKLLTNNLTLIDSIITKYDDVYDLIKLDLIKFVPKKISKASIGDGEFILILLSKNITKADVGDLKINGDEIEIKAAKARFEGTKGYSDPPSYYKSFYANIQKINPNYNSKNPNDINLNLKGLKNILNVIETSEKDAKEKKKLVLNLFRQYLKNQFIKSSTALQNKMLDELIKKDGSFNVSDFVMYFNRFQFDYYKSVDGWKGILFVNPKNMNSVYIKDGNEFINNISKFSVSTAQSWKETRNTTYQYGLR